MKLNSVYLKYHRRYTAIANAKWRAFIGMIMRGVVLSALIYLRCPHGMILRDISAGNSCQNKNVKR